MTTSSQHKTPCKDCPWRRAAMPGWLGPHTADEWLQHAHGESLTMCHTKTNGAQCAGFAIYRANVAKTSRFADALVLPKNHDRVFSTPAEFKAHHERLKK